MFYKALWEYKHKASKFMNSSGCLHPNSNNPDANILIFL